jgi:hydroxymethylpyrimidine/phosphomethylpyrimidine kinase
MTPVALTIAGSDPSGGAGIQADLKTFHQHGVYGMSVVTLLTVQNTQSVSAVRHLDPEFVLAQLDAVLADIPPQAVKTGALGNATIISALAERAAEFSFPLVVDPVMISKHGAALLDEDAVESLKSRLLPHAFCVTPNIPESTALTGINVTDRATMEQAARAIADLGPAHVLIKGGHAAGPALDLLWSGGEFHEFAAERIVSRSTHGTGCVLSAAVTARLACGHALVSAVRHAKLFVTEAIRTAAGLGSGAGPTNMLADLP